MNLCSYSQKMKPYTSIAHTIFLLLAGLKLLSAQDTYYCGGKPADVYFLLDSSTSIWFIDFAKQIKFVENMIELFEIAPNKTRIGLGTFSSNFHPQFSFKDYNNKTQVIGALKSIHQNYGGTNTANAIQKMREREFNPLSARQDVAHIAIILTDGKSWSLSKTAEEAKMAKEKGIYMFAVGIGRNIDLKELKGIASESNKKESQFVFHVRNFDALDSIKEILAIQTCEVVPNDQYRCGASGQADMIFLLDRLVMAPSRIQLIKDFIAKTADLLDMGPNNPVRIGVFTDCPDSEDIYLNDHNDKYSFIKELKITKDKSRIHTLRRVHRVGFNKNNGARTEARKLVILFVDSPLVDAKKVLLEAMKMKLSNIEIFVVTIGNEYLEKEMSRLASRKVKEHTIRVPSYSELNNSVANFVNLICEKL
ncbi:collagen alpha-4(VI) chain [Octopus bimaculoides]|uniref:VWFA domain-containing protein n=1 Tax=Octopus bimaculoides TaxID=37653 RepID=A0A0L8I836_OCTBM|nr:collagen alpha-4(VI) chain [Octopus bimaculoides]|eukprot:XP_014787765.1 PREDICTED: collagen alpha-4(VI) chain-like [Octopus bimaculoides]